MVRFTVCDVTPLDIWRHQAPHCPFQFLFLKGSLQSNTAHNRHSSSVTVVCISHQQGDGWKIWFGHQEAGSATSPCCQMMISRNYACIYFWSIRNRKTHSVKRTQRQQTSVAIMKRFLTKFSSGRAFKYISLTIRCIWQYNQAGISKRRKSKSTNVIIIRLHKTEDTLVK